MNGTGKCVFILGMHRSGTSALAGTLQQAGLALGQVLNNGFALNPKGLWEPPALIYMHEALLEANGGSWQAPPAGSVVWGKLHKAVRDLFIEARQGQPLWGFKEPRTLLLLEGWLEVISDWTAIGIFRHPSEVAQSLHARNGLSMPAAYALWASYNQCLLALHRRQSFPVIEFTSDAAAMQQSIGRALDHLGLQAPQGAQFYEPELKRFDSAAAPAPAEALALYHQLQALAAASAAAAPVHAG